MELSSRQIIGVLLVGLALAFASSLIISKQLSKKVSAESRNRDLSVVFGAIEAGPLAIARLQSAAIAQEQLNLLMANPQLNQRGFLSATITGGPSGSFTYANWKAEAISTSACPSVFERTYQFSDALNAFRVIVERDECLVVEEQRQILKVSSLASLLIVLVTLALITICVWPVADSIRKAEQGLENKFKDLGKIGFSPIRILMREAVRKSELEREQALTTLAQQVSHDIRSPIGTLKMVVALSPELPKERADLLCNAVQRISEISDRLLNQRRQIPDPSRPSSTLLHSSLDQIVREKKVEILARSGIEIKIDFQADTQSKVPLDPGTFSQVLSNVINNSIEAIETEGTITVGVRQSSNVTDVIVSDSGKGIPKEVLKDLSERSLSYGKPNGNGLGLTHARATIESAGGKISIQSKPGVGTLVRLSFPYTT